MQAESTEPEAVMIPLRRHDGSVRAYAIVDAADLPLLGDWRWTLSTTGYARRTYWVRVEGKQKSREVIMHRLIMGVTDTAVQVDHINGRRLDNRRTNLRLATQAQNNQNIRGNRNNKSGYRGVCWDPDRRKWRAQCKANGKVYYLGLYGNPEAASRAAAAFRAKHLPYATS